MRLTPIQVSFSAGQISPLMLSRFDTEGHKQGAQVMENMIPDSRGPARSRSGSRFIVDFPANEGRILALPVNESFFYSVILIEERLVVASMVGHNPSVQYVQNANFLNGADFWSEGSDGNPSSTIIFANSRCSLHVEPLANRFAYISQAITVIAPEDFRIQSTFAGIGELTFKIGTTENSNDIAEFIVNANVTGIDQIVPLAVNDVWVTCELNESGGVDSDVDLVYFGMTDAVPSPVEFVTPYQEADLSTLQGVPSAGGAALYILHELYPPYKLVYNRVSDSLTFEEVAFVSPPAQWVTGSYPSTGDFFEGRLWLGGTVNEPQTFWGSVSGVPEDFTLGTEADDALQFTISKFGRIEWMVGFKNLLIGTANGEHIVTSQETIITPTDIAVEQQSSYGSANVQPVQVGDQIMYVSADRRKLRAIQYEWQANNWLSRDLTFNSEDITKAGIKHIVWHQNPGNLLHCVLDDGNVATMVYDRSNNIYGWTLFRWGGEANVIDMASGPILGTDYANVLVQYENDFIRFETQTIADDVHFVDSWVQRGPDVVDGLIVSGLDHLDDQDCRVLVDGALHPNRTPVGGQIELQYTGLAITVGLGYTALLVTLPVDAGSPLGSGASWKKRWNKLIVRILESAKPIINGERPAVRHPASLMNETEPLRTEDVQVIGLGFDSFASIIIEQDLPYPLTVTGIFGQLEQDIT